MQPLASKDLSLCQQKVFDAVCASDTNSISTLVIVHARGGCGKTRLVLSIAQERHIRGFGHSLLLVCKQGELQKQMQQCSKSQDGLQVEKVHVLLTNYLFRNHTCVKEKQDMAYCVDHCDAQLNDDFYNNVSLIIIDEMQNMDTLQKKAIELLRKLFSVRGKTVSLLGVGDIFQCDKKQTNETTLPFFTDASSYFAHERFVEFSLNSNFRHGPTMCEWINTNMNPHALKLHYPTCWEKYGTLIERYWGQGLSSAKCNKCEHLHPEYDICDTKTSSVPVQVVHVNEYPKSTALAPIIERFVRDTNAVILLNFRSMVSFQQKYPNKYPNVDTPFGFGGCEAKNCVVFGCEYFAEQLSHRNSHNNHKDWPFRLFCQMFVSCTRASESMMLVLTNKIPFFTMRDTLIDINSTVLPLQNTSSTKRMRETDEDSNCKNATKAQSKKQIDARSLMYSLSDETRVSLINWLNIKMINDDQPRGFYMSLSSEEQMNFSSQTASFRDYLKVCVFRFVYNLLIDDKSLPESGSQEWITRIQQMLGQQFNAKKFYVSPLLAAWVSKQTLSLVHLLNSFMHTTLQISPKFGVREPCSFNGLTGAIDFFTFTGCMFVCLDGEQISHLQCYIQFLMCKYRVQELPSSSPARSQLLTTCHVVNVNNMTIVELSLKDYVNQDFFFSKVVTNLPRFEQQFGSTALLLRQVPLVEEQTKAFPLPKTGKT